MGLDWRRRETLSKDELDGRIRLLRCSRGGTRRLRWVSSSCSKNRDRFIPMPASLKLPFD